MKTLFSSLQLHRAFCGRYRSSAKMEIMRSQILTVRAGFSADRQNLVRDRKSVAGDFNRAFNQYRTLHEKRN